MRNAHHNVLCAITRTIYVVVHGRCIQTGALPDGIERCLAKQSCHDAVFNVPYIPQSTQQTLEHIIAFEIAPPYVNTRCKRWVALLSGLNAIVTEHYGPHRESLLDHHYVRRPDQTTSLPQARTVAPQTFHGFVGKLRCALADKILGEGRGNTRQQRFCIVARLRVKALLWVPRGNQLSCGCHVAVTAWVLVGATTRGIS